jgi:hypothetical protein
MRGKYSVKTFSTLAKYIIKQIRLFHSIIIDLLRDINDPEHPMSLEELNVVQITNIEVKYEMSDFTRNHYFYFLYVCTG